MHGKINSRSGDEERLYVLKEAAKGVPLYSINRELGKGTSFSRVVLEKIIKDDLLYSEEDPICLASFYPINVFNSVMNKIIKEGKCTGLTS